MERLCAGDALTREWVNMSRLSIVSWSLCSLSLLACFGKVRYSDEPGMTDDDVSAGGAPTQPDLPVGSGGRLEQGSGGAISEPQACGVDCCPPALTQLRVHPGNGPLDQSLTHPLLSGDGAWVVFSSRSRVLNPENVAGEAEVFLFSLANNALTLVSSPASGANDGSSEPNGVSADGRYVLFTSSSSKIVIGDDNGQSDVFLWDRVDRVYMIPSAPGSEEFGNGPSLGRDISPDGRWVVFSSAASNLVPQDDNAAWDVFVWDRTTGKTERVSMGPGDQQRNPVPGPHAHISADGRFVSFHSQSNQLLAGDADDTFDIYLVDRKDQSVHLASRSATQGAADGNSFVLGMSDDARYFSSYASATNLVDDDSNGVTDVFLFDIERGDAARANLSSLGNQANVGSNTASLSGDGRYVTFASAASSLVPEQPSQFADSYLYDVERNVLTRLSRSAEQVPGNAESDAAQLSASGRCFVFSSQASNLTVQSEDDGVADLFVGALP